MKSSLILNPLFLLLLFIQVFVPSHLEAQQHIYGDPGDQVPSRVIPFSLGFYVLGQEDGMATITRLDQSGNWVWTNKLAIQSALADGVVLPNNSLMVVGFTFPLNLFNKSIIGEISLSGLTYCFNELDQPGFEALSRIKFNGTTYTAVGVQTDPVALQDVVMFDLSPGCTINSKKIFNSLGSDEFANDLEIIGSDFYVAGKSGNSAVIYQYLLATGVSSGGVQSPGGYTYTDLESVGTEMLAIANPLGSGQPRIMRFGTNLFPAIWEVEIFGVSTLNQIVEHNGEIYALGTTVVGGLSRSVIIRIDDTSGPQIVWAKYMDNGESNYVGGSMAILPSGNLSFVDGREHGFGYGLNDIYLSITDDDLTAMCGQTLQLDLTNESTLFDSPEGLDLTFYDVPPTMSIDAQEVMWEQREICGDNPNPDSCVCAMPEITLFQNGIEYALECKTEDSSAPIVGCPTGTVSVGGFFGCIDPLTGEPCPIETPVVYTLTGPNGGTPIDGGTTTNYTQFLFPSSYFQTNGAYQLTLSTLCPGQQDSCVCVLEWIVECSSGGEMNLSCGMAVATCFSGFDKVANTVIKNAPVIALFDVRDPVTSAFPLGSNWAAPKQMFFEGDATHCGQVFGLAIDKNGYILTTSSTIYGDASNTPGFMWTNDGPGAIYRFYYAAGTWKRELFAVLPNNGSGLGNITYDKIHDQFFITNFHDGLIYRIMNTLPTNPGIVASTYQHTGGVSIPSPTHPDFVPLGKRIWGIGFNQNDGPDGRVYFARWNEDKGRFSASVFNEINSVALNNSGDFIVGSEVSEKIMTNWRTTNYSNPVSDIEFSENGDMLIAEKVMRDDIGHVTTHNGLYAHEARIFQYQGATTNWVLYPQTEIFIGNTNYCANSAGGVDYGYKDLDANGMLVGCDDLIWGSGDALMYNTQNDFNNSPDYVYGIAGMPVTGNTHTPGPNWVESTSIYVDLDGVLTIIDKLAIGDVDIYNCPCPASPDIPCDSLMVMYDNITTPQDSCCRWEVDLKNNTGLPNISHAIFHIITPGVIFNEFQAFGGFLLDNTIGNPDTDILVYHQGASIPAGSNSDVVNFCLGGINSSTPVPQQILVTWYQQLGPDHFIAVCSDTIEVECPIMDDSSNDCWSLVDSQVDCNMDNMTYTIQIKVKNETQNETFDYLVFYNFTPGNFGWNPTVVQIPGGLAPSGTSGWLTFTINPYNYSPIPQVICFNISPINIDGDFCCTEPKNVCITLPPCCDACEDSDIILTQVGGNPSNPNDCCYQVGINNLCAWNYFSRIEAEILTGGITFLNHADLNTNWHTIYSNPKELHWAYSFGSFPKGTYNPLFNFCLNNVMNIPQEIEIRWIALDANGNEFVACIDTIETFCPPPVMDTCMLVTPYEVVCNGDGTYDFSMTIYNVSNPPHDATIVSLLPVSPTTTLDYMPQTFGPLSAGNGASYSLTLKGNPGDAIKFYVRFQELIFPPPVEDNWCCYQKDTICITLPPCDTCYCKDPSFTNLFLRGPGGPSIPIQCETSYENIGCPDSGYGFNLTGLFECAGDSCDTQPYVYWELDGPSGGNVASGSSPGPYFGINLLPAYFGQPGIYTMKLTGFCNFDTCTCEFQFIVDCPVQCPCDINDLQADVNQGFNHVLLPRQCQACFNPKALSECDSVYWYSGDPNGTPIGSSIGNNSFCYTFSGSGTYTIFMEVTRKKPDGSNCESFRKSQTVKISCGISPLCDKSVYSNPTFSEGAVAGELDAGGISDSWTSILGHPEVTEGSLGSLDGWTMSLWGNLDTTSILSTINAICLQKDAGTIQIRHNINSPFVWTAGTSLKIVLYTGDTFEFNECDGVNCYEIASLTLPVLDPNEWCDVEIPYDLRNWTAMDSCGNGNGIPVRLAAYITNPLSSNQGGADTYSRIQIDHLCLDGLVVAVDQPTYQADIEIFPNPTNGDLSIELSFPASSKMKMRVMSIEGQILLEKDAESGVSLQSIKTDELPQGMYFLQILSKGQIIAVNKFVKQ